MKKLILLALLFLSAKSFAQSDIFVRNDTAFVVREGDTLIFSYAANDDRIIQDRVLLNRRFRNITQQLPYVKTLESNYTTTSTTPANTGLTFQAQAGKTYKIELIADYQTAATTTGCIVSIGTNGNGSIKGIARGAISASAAASELSVLIRTFSGAGSSLTTTGVSAINTPHFIHIVAVINCTESGVFGVRFGSEVAGSQAQLNSGSILIIQEL